MNLHNRNTIRRGAETGSFVGMRGTFGPCTMKKIYCTCGSIVDLDRDYFNIRMGLGKQIECSHCRNARVSREIDELNNHFLGIDEESSDGVF